MKHPARPEPSFDGFNEYDLISFVDRNGVLHTEYYQIPKEDDDPVARARQTLERISKALDVLSHDASS